MLHLVLLRLKKYLPVLDLDNNLWKEVPVKTGDVLFFPGWINHRTQENTTNEERIVMTYNIDANPTL